MGIYRVKLDGTVIDINEACLELLGYRRPEEVLGKVIRSLHMPDEDQKSYLDALSRTKGLPARETRLFTTGGSAIWALHSATLLESRDGCPPEIQGMLLNIDELKRTENELRSAKQAAEGASLAKSQFLANMSHELRTPLNGVLGMTELLLDNSPSESQREYLDIIRSSAESLLAVINSILEFAPGPTQPLTTGEEFSLRELLEAEMNLARPSAYKKRLKLRSDISPEVAERFRDEPQLIRQILSGLIGNAVKFTAEGEIVVTVSSRGRSSTNQLLSLSVRDTGIGIPSDKQSAIFEPFNQLDNSSTRPFGGAGLGLAIVRNAVVKLGGQISVDSRPGEGSAFSVLFSLALPTDAQTDRPSTEADDMASAAARLSA